MPRVTLLAIVLSLVSCVDTQELASDCALDGGCAPSDAGRGTGMTATVLPTTPEPLTGIRSADLLFVIDDSPGMAIHQQALAARVPDLLNQLLRGDTDDGGLPEFHPLDELRMAVVAANRNVGSSFAPGCTVHPVGQLTVANAATSCMGVHPPLMTFNRDDRSSFGDDLVSTELVCAVQLGGNGCGIAQPLEAMAEGLVAMRDAQGEWREDSLQLVVVLTDREDCSSDDPRLFAPASELPASEALAATPDPLRCSENPNRLTTLEGYREILLELRPEHPGRSLFLPIAGFPGSRTSPAAYSATGFTDTADQEAFYQALFEHERMTYGTSVDPDGHVGSACELAAPPMTPARRLAGLARMLESTARVGSLCADYEEPFDALRRLVATHVGMPAL